MPSDQELLAEFAVKLDTEKRRLKSYIATGQESLRDLIATGQPPADAEACYGPSIAKYEARLAEVETQTPESLLAFKRHKESLEESRWRQRERDELARSEKKARLEAEREEAAKEAAKEAAAQAIIHAFDVFVKCRGERYRNCTLDSFVISSATQARVVEELRRYAALPLS